MSVPLNNIKRYSSTHPKVIDLEVHGIDRNTKNGYIKNGTWLFYKIKSSQPMPQILHFEILSFHSRGNFQSATLLKVALLHECF